MNSKLKIYFYHTRLTRESYEEWKDFRFPGHILYGLPLLEKYGIQAVMHRYKPYANRWKLMLYTTKEILFCKEKYEVLLVLILTYCGWGISNDDEKQTHFRKYAWIAVISPGVTETFTPSTATRPSRETTLPLIPPL